MNWKLLIFLMFLYVGAAVLQARWIMGAKGKTSFQDRCLIPLILSVLLLVLTTLGLRRASGWDTLGWYILVHCGTLPLTGAVGAGTLAGLLLRRKRDKTNEKA